MWGFGDFMIQKVSREMSIWKTFFYIALIGTIGLLPFVWKEIPNIIHSKNLLFLGITGVVITIASIFDYEALRQGKLAIMEPIIGAELPIAAILAVVLWNENLGFIGWTFVGVIFIGNLLASTVHHTHLHYHKRIFEKGVVFALMAAVGMGLVDLLMGVSSQVVSPLLTVWFVWLFMGIIGFVYLVSRNKLHEIKDDIKKYPLHILGLGIFDTMGWVAFCQGSAHMSIAITTAISQSYLLITILLGLIINKETLRWHQKCGVAFATISIILLTIIR
jgi:drug/metabolite transporter (DMT)-like permease